MSEGLYFYDESALLERLTNALKKRPQEIVFLLGSPLTAPLSPSSPGIPDVAGMVRMIRAEFAQDKAQLAALDRELDSFGDQSYQTAFQFLQGRRGQAAANELVRHAVMAARLPGTAFSHFGTGPEILPDDACLLIDQDVSGWHLNPSVQALGRLIAGYRDRFGKFLLTTNFDPLIEVAIHRAGGQYTRTTLFVDGNIVQTQGGGCQVVHLHGYWHGADTLHTSRQLTQPRPLLRNSLGWLLRNKLVIVCGYGGWDDIFTTALIDSIRDETAYPEVLWTFYGDPPILSDRLSANLALGINRGRLSL